MRFNDLIKIVDEQKKDLDVFESLNFSSKESQELWELNISIGILSKEISNNLEFFKSIIEKLDRKVSEINEQNDTADSKIGYQEIIQDQMKTYIQNYEHFQQFFAENYQRNSLENIEKKIERIKSIPSSPHDLTRTLEYLLDQTLILKTNEFNAIQESDRINREECGDNPLDFFEPEALSNIDNYLNR